jgi:hypothetical protein
MTIFYKYILFDIFSIKAIATEFITFEKRHELRYLFFNPYIDYLISSSSDKFLRKENFDLNYLLIRIEEN